FRTVSEWSTTRRRFSEEPTCTARTRSSTRMFPSSDSPGPACSGVSASRPRDRDARKAARKSDARGVQTVNLSVKVRPRIDRTIPDTSTVVDAMNEDSTLLVPVTGRDRPGISARLLSTLSVLPVTIVDLEQVVLAGRLVLGTVIDVDERVAPGVSRRRVLEEVCGALDKTAIDLDMEVEYARGNGRVNANGQDRLHVTVLADPLRPGALGAITSCVARAGANIDRIERLSRHPVTSVEMELSGGKPEPLRAELALEASTQAVDVAVQPSGLHRRGKHLIIMDVDSTLIQ